ncbi:MAG TPA: helix-turn-helix domain-containing protein [Gemmatimonadales bacterium]|jgi:transcriptional regulator GlxA family with amidase domain|nr:helix-turn-helix domain-containing protein [Gemmatimonadales bacterium]
MIARARPIDLLFVIAPHSLLLDIAGPAEAFRLANLHRQSRGLPPRFRLRFAGPVRTVATSVGVGLADLEPLPQRLSTPTWVVLVGQPTATLGQVTPAIATTAHWLKHLLREPLSTADFPHRVLAICSGALLAARAGLIDTRRCTTHHELLHALRALAPRAEVIDNRVFVVDGPLASSAGITAGIDLALHLIAEECGEALAASVAEDMVVYLRRSPRDPELSPFLVHRRHLHQAVHRVQDAIITKPTRDWTMTALASVAHATERHLLRLFIDHAGVSPLQYLRSIRLERARQAIECGARIAEAAEVAGFRSGLQMRRAWKQQWGGSPRDVARAADTYHRRRS